MKVFGGFGGFRVLFFAPGIRKELSAADSAGVGSTFCFCMKLFRNLEIMVANFQQIVYNKFTNKRFFIQNISKEECIMVQIIAGRKGKGKTKYLLDMANTAVKEAKGSIVYLDKSSKHMYELNNKIRLINVAEFSVSTAEGFIGFICGIISQDHDLEAMYLDSFLKLAGLEGEDITATLAELDQISAKYHVNFVLSVSMDGEELPESAKDMVLVAL